MDAKNIQFHHRHTFNTVCGAICEKLDTTTYTINGDPQKTWGELIGGEFKPTLTQLYHGGSNCPENAFKQLEPYMQDKIYYAIADAMKPYLGGQCDGVEIDLQINLNINYK